MKTFQISNIILGCALYARYGSALGFTVQLFDADNTLKHTIATSGIEEEKESLGGICTKFDDGGSNYPLITKATMKADVNENDTEEDWKKKMPAIVALYGEGTECVDKPKWGEGGFDPKNFPSLILDTLVDDFDPKIEYTIDLTKAPTLMSTSRGVDMSGRFTHYMFVYDILNDDYWKKTIPEQLVKVAGAEVSKEVSKNVDEKVSEDPKIFEAQQKEYEKEAAESPFLKKFVSFDTDLTGDEDGDAVDEEAIKKEQTSMKEETQLEKQEGLLEEEKKIVQKEEQIAQQEQTIQTDNA